MYCYVGNKAILFLLRCMIPKFLQSQLVRAFVMQMRSHVKIAPFADVDPLICCYEKFHSITDKTLQLTITTTRCNHRFQNTNSKTLLDLEHTKATKTATYRMYVVRQKTSNCNKQMGRKYDETEKQICLRNIQ
jgi:hypothetical protein